MSCDMADADIDTYKRCSQLLCPCLPLTLELQALCTRAYEMMMTPLLRVFPRWGKTALGTVANDPAWSCK